MLPMQYAPELTHCDMEMPFACRGCGEGCCAHRTVSLNPMDSWRLGWHLMRVNLPKAVCYLLLDPLSGFPALVMTGEPCQYLIEIRQPEEEGTTTPTGQKWCGVWKERPLECRAFPVRVELELRDGRDLPVAREIQRCPGAAGPNGGGETLSIYKYARSQIGEERWMELFLYTSTLLRELRGRGLYWEGVGGRLREREVLNLGANLLYRTPPPSPDPAADHLMVLELLKIQVEFVQEGGYARWISPSGMDVPAPARPIRSAG